MREGQKCIIAIKKENKLNQYSSIKKSVFNKLQNKIKYNRIKRRR